MLSEATETLKSLAKSAYGTVFDSSKYDMSFALNYYFRNIDQYSYHSELQQKLSQQTQRKLLAAYQDSIGLPPGKINTTRHADNFLTQRKDSLIGFPGVTFTETPDISGMKKTLETLDSALKQIGGKYRPDNLLTYLQTEKTDALKKITKQQEADIDAIITAIADPAEQSKMIVRLKESQKSQYDVFEKAFIADSTALHQAAKLEQKRVSFFALMRQENEEIRKKINNAYMNKGAGHVDVSMGGESAVLKDRTLDEMMEIITDVQGNFKSLTGQSISAQKTASGAYTFSIQYPSTMWSRYYSHRSNRSKVDALVMANLLKLSGEENPVVRVDGFQKNPAIALKLARDLYEAAREVGYPEKNITVIINGKKQTVDELFKDAPSRRAEMETRIKGGEETPSASDQAIMKQEMDAYRKTSPSEAAAPEETSTSAAGGPPPGA